MEDDRPEQKFEFPRAVFGKPLRDYWLRGRGAQNAFLLCPVDLWLFELETTGLENTSRAFHKQ